MDNKETEPYGSDNRVNPYAVIALVATLMGAIPVGLVFGCIALKHPAGQKLARAALILSVVEIALVVAIAAWLVTTTNSDDAAGTPTNADLSIKSPDLVPTIPLTDPTPLQGSGNNNVTLPQVTPPLVTTGTTFSPILLDCNDASTTEPSRVTFACGDGASWMDGIHWENWNSDSALGEGELHSNTCNPNCAAGNTIKEHATIRLSEPEALDHHFSAIDVTTSDGASQHWER